MKKLADLFEEYVCKAINGTEKIINEEFDDPKNLNFFLDNRDRLLQIITKISNEINWEEIDQDKKDHLSLSIEYLKKLDEKLIIKLQEYKNSLKNEIERTFKQKENIKGYNLNNTR